MINKIKSNLLKAYLITVGVWIGIASAQSYCPSNCIGGDAGNNWCPNDANDFAIDGCSNCTIKLSCNVDGTGEYGIEILDVDNVTLDGDYYTLSNFEDQAVYVSGGADDLTIKNLYIEDAGNSGSGHGIRYDYYSSGYQSVDNVSITGSADNGINHPGPTTLAVENSSITYNDSHGIFASSLDPDASYLDIMSSWIVGNGSSGAYHYDRPYSWIKYNQFYYNAYDGLTSYYSDGSVLDDNDFALNTNGLVINGEGITLENNTGSNNPGEDCIGDISSVYGDNNSWGSYQGASCLP